MGQDDWFNERESLSSQFTCGSFTIDHLEFGTFPRDGTPAGLAVSVPSADNILLATQVENLRGSWIRCAGETERLDILNLMPEVVGIATVEDAVVLLGKYFPVSAASSEKQRFLIEEHEPAMEGSMRPNTLAEAVEKHSEPVAGEMRSSSEFVDAFDLAKNRPGSPYTVDRAESQN